MASPSAPLRAPFPLARWWAGKSAGERRIIAALALVIGAALAWWVIWQPMSRDIVALRAANARGAAALVDARAMADESAGLVRSGAPAANADARSDLEHVLARQGLHNAVTQLDWQDGRARLVFAAVGYDPLIAALEVLQRDVQLRLVQGTLTARVEPGTVRAELVLAR